MKEEADPYAAMYTEEEVQAPAPTKWYYTILILSWIALLLVQIQYIFANIDNPLMLVLVIPWVVIQTLVVLGLHLRLFLARAVYLIILIINAFVSLLLSDYFALTLYLLMFYAIDLHEPTKKGFAE